MRKSRIIAASLFYTAYCFFVFDTTMTYEDTGHASEVYLAGALAAFIPFTMIFLIGLTRWSRKRFPQKNRKRNG